MLLTAIFMKLFVIVISFLLADNNNDLKQLYIPSGIGTVILVITVFISSIQ